MHENKQFCTQISILQPQICLFVHRSLQFVCTQGSILCVQIKACKYEALDVTRQMFSQTRILCMQISILRTQISPLCEQGSI